MLHVTRWFGWIVLGASAFFLIGCATPRANPHRPAPVVKESQPVGLFEDATERAGIRFHHTNGETFQYPFLQTVGGGCAFLDYNSDGFQDILLLSCGNFPPSASEPPNLALYHNEGNGTFTDVTQGSGLDKPLGYAQGIAVGDYDNDGYSDVFVAGYGRCYLFNNRGVRREAQGVSRGLKPKTHLSRLTSRILRLTPHVLRFFEDVTEKAGLSDTESGPRWASGAAWGDYDNDGRLDLYVCHYAVWSPAIDRKCRRADGTERMCPPSLYKGDVGRLYHNEGNGRFRDVSRQAGMSGLRRRSLAAVWLDYDNDGDEDLFVANDMDPNTLWRNNGNGTFTDTSTEAGVAFGMDGRATSDMGIAVGDYQNCGRESLFVTVLPGEVFSLYRNDGGGQFTYASEQARLRLPTLPHSGWGVAFLDFDRDGWLDIVTGNGNVSPFVDEELPGVLYAEPMGLFHNTGQGTFTDISEQAGAMTRKQSTRGLAVGDYDNDGRLDVLCVNRNARAELLRNVSPDQNYWVSLRLVGVKSNRDGAGAKVWVTAGGIRRYAQCRLSSSYASSSDKRLFFGLGTAERVDKLEILWTNGQRDIYRALEANRFYVVTEGRGYVHLKRR